MKKTTLEIVMACIVLVVSFTAAKKSSVLVSNMQLSDNHVIVIDAGHGGMDPGKIGVNNAQEKDINLSIAKKLKKYLEKDHMKVILTRDSDKGLYKESSTNKKVEDMQNRCSVIEDAKPLCTISIHQNSFEEESVYGAQVFYYSESKEGKELAQCIQEELNTDLALAEPRNIKANNNYYMLKNTVSPTVIVECGFLSNWKEAKLLVSEEYQEKIAKAVEKAAITYIKSRSGT